MSAPDEPNPLPMTRAQEFEHLLLHPGVHPLERYPLLRAWEAGRDFRDQMNTLITQAGVAPEEIDRLRARVLRLADTEDGEPQG